LRGGERGEKNVWARTSFRFPLIHFRAGRGDRGEGGKGKGKSSKGKGKKGREGKGLPLHPSPTNPVTKGKKKKEGGYPKRTPAGHLLSPPGGTAQGKKPPCPSVAQGRRTLSGRKRVTALPSFLFLSPLLQEGKGERKGKKLFGPSFPSSLI